MSWVNSSSNSCSEYNALENVFKAFQKTYEGRGSQRELRPVTGKDWSRSAFKSSDGWTMEKYAGSDWNMTTYSKWFVEGGKGYTVQVRSTSEGETPSYDLILYDESGKSLASIEEYDCLEKLVGKYSEREHLPLVQGALQAIMGSDVSIRVNLPPTPMWFSAEVEIDKLPQS